MSSRFGEQLAYDCILTILTPADRPAIRFQPRQSVVHAPPLPAPHLRSLPQTPVSPRKQPGCVQK
ncbi:MAG: hypothetical protein K1X65_09435 [Caldilineales bacterium]|nr:hypothetical protein [Caldilineales bacterium]